MPRTVTAQQDDTLDLLCWRELGATSGLLEQAYALNRGLADAGPLLAEGTVVILPDPPAATAALRETVNLWD
jgi:phage tail protein X